MVGSMDKWKGKVAIVTGTSAGIGAATATTLVKAGLKVVGLDRQRKGSEKLAKKLEGKSGRLYPIKVDITREEEILETFKWVMDNLGPIHILVNNAGIVNNTNLLEGDTTKWKEILDTNVLGLSIATREAIKDMRANNVDGHIININSTSGHKILGVPNLSLYPASKFAVTALTETLRQELNLIRSKIKVTSVSPGFVATKEVIGPLKTYPMLQPEDVADAVVFALATPSHVQINEIAVQPVGERLK